MYKNKKIILGAAILSSFLLFSGCALFLVGAGITGGYAISKDTIEGTMEKPIDRVWKASHDVLMHEGFIKLEDKMRGKIEAEVRGSQVEVQINQATERTVKLQVKARKGYKLLPNMDLANELYNKIYQKIK